MHATNTTSTRPIPISLWISAALFVVYCVPGVAVSLSVRDVPLNILVLLMVSPLMFIGMVISVVDIVRTRNRGNINVAYARLQWVGLGLMVLAMPLWMTAAIVIVSLT